MGTHPSLNAHPREPGAATNVTWANKGPNLQTAPGSDAPKPSTEDRLPGDRRGQTLQAGTFLTILDPPMEAWMSPGVLKWVLQS